MANLNNLIQQFRNKLGADFISTGIIGMKDGLSIAWTSILPDFNEPLASARFAVVTRQAVKITAKINMGNLKDTLTTSENAFIMTRLLGDNSYYWGVFATRNATLGMLRILMNEYEDPLWEAIPH